MGPYAEPAAATPVGKRRPNKTKNTMISGISQNNPMPIEITPQPRRPIDVERVTTIREVIPVETDHPQQAFDLAALRGEVLTSETTVEYVIRNYPTDY